MSVLAHSCARTPSGGVAPCKGADACAALRLREADRTRLLLDENAKGFALSFPKQNSRPRVAVAVRPLARSKGSDSAFPLPTILAGRQSRMPQAVRLRLKEGRFEMNDLLLNYRACGAECRDDHLRDLANENGLLLECVQRIAERLGEREDFGALVLICEERHARRVNQAQGRVQ